MTERRLRECPRKVRPSGTARPLPLTIRQCCTHRLVVKCVQSQACPCQASIRPCTSICPSANFRKRGPTRPPPPGERPLPPTALRITSNVNRNIKKAHEAATILCQATPPQLYFTHQTSSWMERSGPPYQLALKPPTQPYCSPRPPPLTPPYQRPLGAAK